MARGVYGMSEGGGSGCELSGVLGPVGLSACMCRDPDGMRPHGQAAKAVHGVEVSRRPRGGKEPVCGSGAAG